MLSAHDALAMLVDLRRERLWEAYERAVDRYHMLAGAAASGATLPDPPEPPDDED